MFWITGHVTPLGAFEIRNVASNLVADVIGGSSADLQGVILFPRNNLKHQDFSQNAETDGSFSLSASHSFKCLDVIGALGDDGAAIIQFKCHFGPNQRWTLQRMGAGVILRAVHSGKCLDADNADFPRPPRSEARLQQWTCISGPNDPNAVNQIFRLGF